MGTPRGGGGYRGRDRRAAPAPHALTHAAATRRDAARVLGLAGSLCVTAMAVHTTVPRATAAVTLLLAGFATGACFVVSEQSYVRWRLVGDAVAGRLSIAYVVFGCAVVPLATTDADGVPGGVAQTLGTVGVAAVLITTLRCPDVDSRARIVTPAALVTVAAAVAAVLTASTPAARGLLGGAVVLGQPWIEVAGAGVLVVAAGAVTAAGIRRRRRTLARTGLALALLVVTPAVAAVGPTPPAAHLLAAAVQVGAVALVLPMTSIDTRLALRAVGRANATLRHRWLDAEAEARDLSREEAERTHELRSALLALEGASDVLRRHVEGLGRSDDAALAAAVSAELGRLHHLVERAGEPPVVVYGLTDALTPLVLARRACGQQIDLDVPPGTTVVGRPGALAEAVGNLLENSAAHAPGARVTLSTTRHEGRVRLLVRDDGPGFSPGRPALPARRRGPDARHGLGLAVAARLVAQDGGRLVVLPGRGATVAIDLEPGPAASAHGREPWTATAS